MKKLFIISLLVSAVGCSGLDTGSNGHDILKLQNKTLSLIIHERPDFLAVTPDKDMLNQAGFNAAISDGRKLLQEHDIKDPASKICKSIAKTVGSKYGILHNKNLVNKSKSKDMERLVRLANGRDYILTVETTGWLFEYETSNPSEYRIKYLAKARLIDANKAKSLEKSSCNYDSLRAGKPLARYEELLKNNAAFIKQSLSEASAFCVNKFETELFGSLD